MNSKLLSTFYLIFCSVFTATAQQPVFDWAHQIDGDIFVLSMCSDVGGNFYVTGTYSGTVDFDPGPGVESRTEAGFGDIFIIRLSGDGKLLWVRTIGGISYDQGSSIATDSIGNVYITGFFNDTVDFESGTGAHVLVGAENTFVLKLDTTGATQWVRQLAESGENSGNSIAVNESGELVVTGVFSGAADFNPGSGSDTLVAPISDTYIWKLSNTGDMTWAKQITSTTTGSHSYSATFDNAGNVLVCGLLLGTTDLDPGPGIHNFSTSSPTRAGNFLLKLDPGGNYIWARTWDNTDMALFNGCVFTIKTGEIFLGGRVSGTADLDPGSGSHSITSSPGSSHFLLALDEEGNYIWSTSMSDFRSIAVDEDGNIYTGGDGIKKLTNSGALVWTWPNALVTSLTTDHEGNIFSSGLFTGFYDFDEGVATHGLSGSNSTFFLKIKPQATSILSIAPNSAAGLEVFPNPSNGYFYIKSTDSRHLVITNTMGQAIKRITVSGKRLYRIDDLPVGIFKIWGDGIVPISISVEK